MQPLYRDSHQPGWMQQPYTLTPEGYRPPPTRVTFHDITSGQKATLGWTLHNFRLRMRAHFQGSRFGVKWPSVTSLPVAMLIMRNGTFCTTTLVRKKRGNRLRVRRTYFRDWRHFLLGHIPVTSLPVMSLSAHAHAITSGNTPWNTTLSVLICYLSLPSTRYLYLRWPFVLTV